MSHQHIAHTAHHPRDHADHDHSSPTSLDRLAFSATLHCMTGCGTGEVLGLVIGTWLGWGTWETIALAVSLAFLFGYAFTLVPLFRSGMSAKEAFRIALAADTASITVMEIVDNGVMLLIPGAMAASLGDPLFWGAMAFSIIVAGVAAFPINRWLIARGKGHSLAHAHHTHH